MNPTDGNFKANPGYGNDANVGYSPGQTGPVGPGWAKFDFQHQQYMNTYGYENRALFARYPLTFTVMFYPMAIFSVFMAYLIAGAVISMAWDVTPIFGIIAFVVVGAVALGFMILALVLWPLGALIMHRRRGGMFAEHLAWTDKFAHGMDFEYYENPHRRPS